MGLRCSFGIGGQARSLQVKPPQVTQGLLAVPFSPKEQVASATRLILRSQGMVRPAQGACRSRAHSSAGSTATQEAQGQAPT